MILFTHLLLELVALFDLVLEILVSLLEDFDVLLEAIVFDFQLAIFDDMQPLQHRAPPTGRVICAEAATSSITSIIILRICGCVRPTVRHVGVRAGGDGGDEILS